MLRVVNISGTFAIEAFLMIILAIDCPCLSLSLTSSSPERVRETARAVNSTFGSHYQVTAA
jgi:hypothetical protein